MSDLGPAVKLEIIGVEREQLLAERYHLELKARVAKRIGNDSKPFEEGLLKIEAALDELAAIEREVTQAASEPASRS